MNVVSLQAYRDQRCDCSVTCSRAVTHWDDEDDDCLDIEDDEPWWHYRPSLALLACWLLTLAALTPTARLFCWVVLWAAYLIGTEASPPPAWTPWAPHLFP